MFELIAEAMDVKKQRDLSGFYRHILKQTTGDDPGPKVKDEVPKIKEEKIDVKEVKTEKVETSSQQRYVVKEEEPKAYMFNHCALHNES